MEILGVSSTFRFRFFLASTPNNLAFRRLPPAASTLFRSPPPPCLSHAPPPQRHGNRRLAVLWPTITSPPASVEDESRAILHDFLKEDDGMRSALEEQKALEIVELLSSKLRSLHESEQQLGIQLKVPQLVDVFTPYLRSLLKEYDDVRLIGADGQLPSAPPGWEKTPGENPRLRYKKKIITQLEMQLSEGCPPPHVLCLMNLGLDLLHIRSMIRKYHYVSIANIKKKLDSMMEFLTSHGVPESDVPQVLYRCPQLICSNIEETIMPIMALLESKGVDKAQWPDILCLRPNLLSIGKTKVEAIVEYFSEMGLSDTAIGRLLTKNPWVIEHSIEAKIKPTDRFLLDRGFSMEEVHGIISTVNIYEFNLERNLKPKWDFLLRMGYTRLDLLKYPSYFTHSLEKRIKPRYELAAKLGIRWSLCRLLTPSNARFEHNIKSPRRRRAD